MSAGVNRRSELLRLLLFTTASMAAIFLLSTAAGSRGNTRTWLETALSVWLPGLLPSYPPAELAVFHTVLRKAAHIGEYAVLGFFTLRLFYTSRPARDRLAIACAVACCLLYAASDELHQTQVGTRTASPIDVGYDTLGAVAGITFGYTRRSRAGRA